MILEHAAIHWSARWPPAFSIRENRTNLPQIILAFAENHADRIETQFQIQRSYARLCLCCRLCADKLVTNNSIFIHKCLLSIGPRTTKRRERKKCRRRSGFTARNPLFCVIYNVHFSLVAAIATYRWKYVHKCRYIICLWYSVFAVEYIHFVAEPVWPCAWLMKTKN